ncbi:DUF6602 domain-containing protein [Nonomuraea mesophila]|uniref:DUF6602 domain-containing protein n=1 Tax=Nonomuraea mesophila TaxID=2530382 RepID=UPI00319E895A
MPIREILTLQERALRSKLDLCRGSLRDSTSKGNQLEIATRSWLRSVLPRGLWVGHGEIIDTNGSRCTQQDVIIAFDDHPRFFDEEIPQPFFFEGVAAVVEVKAAINSGALKNVAKKASSFRKLQHQWVKIGITKNGNKMSADMPDQLAYTAAPPFALLGFESRMSACKVTEALSRFPSRLIDAAFLLKEPKSTAGSSSAWCVNYPNGSFRYRHFLGRQVATGWNHDHGDFALAAFLTWLVDTINYRQMPRGLMEPYWSEARKQV